MPYNHQLLVTKKFATISGNGRTSVHLVRMTWAKDAKGEAKNPTPIAQPTMPRIYLADSSFICFKERNLNKRTKKSDCFLPYPVNVKRNGHEKAKCKDNLLHGWSFVRCVFVKCYCIRAQETRAWKERNGDYYNMNCSFAVTFCTVPIILTNFIVQSSMSRPYFSQIEQLRHPATKGNPEDSPADPFRTYPLTTSNPVKKLITVKMVADVLTVSFQSSRTMLFRPK